MFSVNINNDCPQNIDPIPINISFVIYPINILPIANNINGIAAIIDASCVLSIYCLNELLLFKNVKNTNLNE